MGLQRLVRSRLARRVLLASVLGYMAIPAAVTAQVVAHAAATKTKTKTCGAGGSCTTSLSSQPPPPPVGTSPGGSGGGGGGSTGGGGSGTVCGCTLARPPAYSTFNVHALARAPGRRIQSGSKLIESLDAGHKLVCPGYTRKDRRNWFEFMLASKTPMGITYEITDVIHNRPAKGVHFCAGLGYRFKTLSGRPARHAKLPDGTPGWIGLLPDCERDSAGAVTSTGPCVLSTEESTDSAGNVNTALMVQIPAMSLTDPWAAG
jgi:hypothetical protein